MQICMLLRNNGIIPIATEYTNIDNITDANEYKLVHEYGVAFTELDTSKHDEQARADERAKIVEIINKAEDKLVGCYKNPKDIMTIRMAFAELREDIDKSN